MPWLTEDRIELTPQQEPEVSAKSSSCSARLLQQQQQQCDDDADDPSGPAVWCGTRTVDSLPPGEVARMAAGLFVFVGQWKS